MNIGVDASNISSGGGLTHLVELLRCADPARHGFSTIRLWAARRTLDRIEPRPWLIKAHLPVLEEGFLQRAWWQRRWLGRHARDCGCDVLFVPGGSAATDFAPLVTMSRNLLPFEFRELRRYGLSLAALKQLALRWTQSHSFRRASGTIFLTGYAERAVLAVAGELKGRKCIIPHGVDQRFMIAPRPQRHVADCSPADPFRLLYVSSVDHYKHQWHVADAVALLRRQGLPVSVEFVGSPTTASALRRLLRRLHVLDPQHVFLRYLGGVEHRQLHERYAAADAFVYASSCENLPNILLEAMAAGLPIASSSAGPMPEVLGDAGVYFDPEKPESIAAAVGGLLLSPELRGTYAQRAHARASTYSWQGCADATFAFLGHVLAASRESSYAR